VKWTAFETYEWMNKSDTAMISVKQLEEGMGYWQ